MCTTNPTCCPDAKPGHRSGKPATDRLIYGTTKIWVTISWWRTAKFDCNSIYFLKTEERSKIEPLTSWIRKRYWYIIYKSATKKLLIHLTKFPCEEVLRFALSWIRPSGLFLLTVKFRKFHMPQYFWKVCRPVIMSAYFLKVGVTFKNIQFQLKWLAN
jgi:hypothetical protein